MLEDEALNRLLVGPYPPIRTTSPPKAIGREGRPEPRVSRQVKVSNPLGLHLRAAVQFVRLAGQFRADVRVVCEGRQGSGRSILDLTTLAAGCGSRLELEADGPDAEIAVAALAQLIERRFDEVE
jgi:phosphocarrier protein